MRLRPILLLAGASFLWGSGWVLAPLLAEVAAPYAAGALLFAAASFTVLPALLLKNTAVRVPARTTLVLALTLLAVPAALLTEAGRHGAAGTIPLLYAALPLMVSFAGDGWSRVMIIAIGATLVLLNGSASITLSKLPWELLPFTAVALQAFALRYAAARLRSCPLAALVRSLALQCALAAALLAMISLLLDPAPRHAPPAQWTAASTVALGLLAAFGTALPYTLFLLLLAQNRLRPEQAAATQWLQLLVGFAEVSALARTRPALSPIIAAVVLLACLFAVLRASPSTDDTPLSLGDTRPREDP